MPVTVACFTLTLESIVEQVAERVADRGRLEEVGRDLVQERLERVVVVLVDEQDVGVGVPSFLIAPTPPNPAPSTTIRGRSGIEDSSSRVARDRTRPRRSRQDPSLECGPIESLWSVPSIARTG
jgi:hypothetical protein